MRKLLIYWMCGASLLTAGCESIKNIGNAVPDALDRMPVIYRPDVQQGNVVTQEMVSKLQPGMSKSQVRYIMGTPMLVDVFHQERWDYLYSMKQGNDEREQKRVALYFDYNSRVRIEGDFRPIPEEKDELEVHKDAVVTVPDYVPQNKGIFTRTLETIGIKEED